MCEKNLLQLDRGIEALGMYAYEENGGGVSGEAERV
jgi:hypothetical protein